MARNQDTMQHISEIVEQLMGQLEEMAEQAHVEDHVPDLDLLDGDDNECFFI